MENDLLTRGLELMLVGMGTVFLFLTSLVLATQLMSFLVRRFSAPPLTVDDVSVEADTVAAIAAAVAAYRRRR